MNFFFGYYCCELRSQMSNATNAFTHLNRLSVVCYAMNKIIEQNKAHVRTQQFRVRIKILSEKKDVRESVRE